MPVPIAVLTDKTASADVVSGPGGPTMIVGGKPVSHIGDLVAGAACTGPVVSSPHPAMLIKGIPVSGITSNVSGVNPASGAPVAMPLAVPSCVKFII